MNDPAAKAGDAAVCAPDASTSPDSLSNAAGAPSPLPPTGGATTSTGGPVEAPAQYELEDLARELVAWIDLGYELTSETNLADAVGWHERDWARLDRLFSRKLLSTRQLGLRLADIRARCGDFERFLRVLDAASIKPHVALQAMLLARCVDPGRVGEGH